MILIVGDAMIDRYYFGNVTRVSPEAPVPVLAYGRQEDRAGGAANVSRNCQAMGAEVLTAFSISYRTTPVIKLRLVARTQQIARVDFDTPQEAVNLEEVRNLAARCRVAIVSDYGKGALPNLQATINACRDGREGIRVLVDPRKRCHASAYRGADVLKPNHFEMQAMVGEWSDEAELERLAVELMAEHSIGAILMTRGERGMTLFRGNGSFHIGGRRLPLYDVSGAGDTAIAALAVALDRGADLVQAAELANRAAGIAVTKFGTSVVTAQEMSAR